MVKRDNSESRVTGLANSELRVANKGLKFISLLAIRYLLFAVFTVGCTLLPLLAQQPQAPAGTPLYSVNAKYVNGMAPGYWPTAGTGLVLNLSSGTAYCGNPPVPVSYPGGSLALTASATNYVYLDPASNCSPAASTAAFAAGQIPIATVVTGASSITSITDARTWFTPQPCVTGSAGDLHCSSLGTNQNIALSPSGSGAAVITNLADKGGQVYNVNAYGSAAAALAAIPSTGGVLYFPDGNYTISSTLTSSHPVTVRLPCGTITANAQLFDGQSSDIRLIGCGSGWDGSGADTTPTQTTVIKAGASYPAATDMIYFGSATRTSRSTVKIAGEQVRGVAIDMNSNTGNAIHTVSADHTLIDGVKVWNCVNCAQVQAALSGDPNHYASYHTTIRDSQFQPVAGSTGYAFWFNAQYGEISYNNIVDSRFSGNITNGGGLSELLFQAGSSASADINHTVIKTSYIANPVCSSGSYGIRFEAPGNFLASSGGWIENVDLEDSLIERLFSCSSGYPVGGTSGGSPSSAGLGSFILDNLSSGANWAANLLAADLGSGTIRIVGNETGPLNSSPLVWVSGSQQGTNSAGIKVSNSPDATANNSSLYGLYVSPTFTDGSYTGVKHIVANFATPSASGYVNLGPNVYLAKAGQDIDGSCTMAGSTSCTSTVSAGSRCIATVQGTTPIASACQISGGTLRVTAASSNSDTWAWHITN